MMGAMLAMSATAAACGEAPPPYDANYLDANYPDASMDAARPDVGPCDCGEGRDTNPDVGFGAPDTASPDAPDAGDT